MDNHSDKMDKQFNSSSVSEEIFIITRVKNTVLWTYVIADLSGE